MGPSEQTREQRQEIATQAILITQAEDHHANAALLALYDRYVVGETDLYAISVLVGEQTPCAVEPAGQQLDATTRIPPCKSYGIVALNSVA